MGYSQSSLIHLVGPSDCTLLGFVHGGELAAWLRVGLGTGLVPGHTVGFSTALVEGKESSSGTWALCSWCLQPLFGDNYNAPFTSFLLRRARSP